MPTPEQLESRKPPIKIHPYDLGELFQGLTTLTPDEKGSIQFKTLGENVFELNGQIYHRSVDVPRTDGPHTIF